ncbi:unnamed protein product [Pleuronectes platessa]|uniref:Uncharacterized protein n=1 Tax=Pleuronectes platessa TaxID=8262 RepID=A0A9N7Z6N3_PLEPL|nr:unnamed protein product [Pleuronectes platessa]
MPHLLKDASHFPSRFLLKVPHASRPSAQGEIEMQGGEEVNSTWHGDLNRCSGTVGRCQSALHPPQRLHLALYHTGPDIDHCFSSQPYPLMKEHLNAFGLGVSTGPNPPGRITGLHLLITSALRRRFRVRCEPGVTALERRLVQRRRNWKAGGKSMSELSDEFLPAGGGEHRHHQLWFPGPPGSR